MKRSDGWWSRLFRRRGAASEKDSGIATGEATLAFEERRFADAEKYLRRAVHQAEARAADHPVLATALNDLAEVYRAQAKYDEAVPLYRRAIEIAEKSRGPHDASLARPLNSLALVYRAQGMYDEAEPLCQRAIGILEKSASSKSADDPILAPSVNNLLAVYLAQGRYGEALPLYRRVVALKERILGPAHPDLAGSFGNYAALLRKMKQEEEAAAWEARARKIRGAKSGRSDLSH
jgi:tetratricopeptide (TPR) repeat protein